MSKIKLEWKDGEAVAEAEEEKEEKTEGGC